MVYHQPHIGRNFCCWNREGYLIDGLGDGLRLGDLREELDIVLVAEELLHPLVLAREGLIHPNELHVKGMHKSQHKNAPLGSVSRRSLNLSGRALQRVRPRR